MSRFGIYIFLLIVKQNRDIFYLCNSVMFISTPSFALNLSMSRSGFLSFYLGATHAR